MAASALVEERKASIEYRDHLCAHLRRSCPECVRCFHGWHRCTWCFRTTSGLPGRPRRPRPRCASCGRFRPAAIGPECARCQSFGFVALTLF